jgi:hypothetical protein
MQKLMCDIIVKKETAIAILQIIHAILIISIVSFILYIILSKLNKIVPMIIKLLLNY